MRSRVLYLHNINVAITTIDEFITGMSLEEFFREFRISNVLDPVSR